MKLLGWGYIFSSGSCTGCGKHLIINLCHLAERCGGQNQLTSPDGVLRAPHVHVPGDVSASDAQTLRGRLSHDTSGDGRVQAEGLVDDAVELGERNEVLAGNCSVVFAL